MLSVDELKGKVRRLEPGVKVPGDGVCVDRRTKWGNPFVVGRDGTRDQCVALYIKWVMNAPEAGSLRRAIRHGELSGKNLYCWCSPKLCHGHVLALLDDMFGPEIDKEEA